MKLSPVKPNLSIFNLSVSVFKHPRMGSSQRDTIKAVVALKRENEQLQELINFLQMENFEYSLKENRIQNIISNVESVIRNNPQKLLEASENLYCILEACGRTTAAEASYLARKPVETPRKMDSPSSCKAHAVKPHMVNGTVLYVPTISLTRVSDTAIHSKNQKPLQSGSNTSLQSNSNSSISTGLVESEPRPSTSNTRDESHLDSFSEPSTSKSPAHSTVLSGTFQEVKIFMNQVSQEKDNEESRKSVNLRRRQSSGNLPKCKKRASNK